MIKNYIKLMRVHHYLKNFLIFLPIVFSRKLFDFELLRSSFAGFAAFSLICSCVYILNDINDAERDRMHETKCLRPIASGKISVRAAYLFLICLLTAFAAVTYLCFRTLLTAWLLPVIYLCLNIMYSMRLKNYPIIDIVLLSSGFLIRVLYGAAITGIPASVWLCLTVISGSLYLSMGKRRNEMRCQKKECRRVLLRYSYDFLDKNMYMNLAITIVFYSLWAISFAQGNNVLWTVPILLAICMKYNLNIETNCDGDPIEVIIKDKMLVLLVLLYTVLIFLLLYVNR